MQSTVLCAQSKVCTCIEQRAECTVNSSVHCRTADVLVWCRPVYCPLCYLVLLLPTVLPSCPVLLPTMLPSSVFSFCFAVSAEYAADTFALLYFCIIASLKTVKCVSAEYALGGSPQTDSINIFRLSLESFIAALNFDQPLQKQLWEESQIILDLTIASCWCFFIYRCIQ